MSRHLAELAFASGDLMPAVAKVIVPRLVPIEHMFLSFENPEELPESTPRGVIRKRCSRLRPHRKLCKQKSIASESLDNRERIVARASFD